MITITLDTSCLDPDYPELNNLASLKMKDKIELYVEIVTELEKLEWKNEEKRNKILRWINMYTKPYLTIITSDEKLRWTDKKYPEIYRKIVAIHSPEFKNFKNWDELKSEKYLNKRADWKICTYHILLKRDFFVTNDKKGFIGKNREKQKQFEEIFGIKIRLLNIDFINEWLCT